MATWTLRSLLDAAAVAADVDGDATLRGIRSDSRDVAPGDLFCCVPGANVDGHTFASAAEQAGAAALLVDHAVDVALPQAQVASVRPVLGPLAASFFEHPSRRAPVAA